MALQSMILDPPKLWENRSQEPPPPPPPGKMLLEIKDLSYNKWAQFRLHQDP